MLRSPSNGFPPSRSNSSSMSSTFSDLSASSSGAKTAAFFSSPFAVSPPPPSPPSSPPSKPPVSAPPRSLTADFFATPVRPPSPPPKHPASATASTFPHAILQQHPERLFPSRYKPARDPLHDDDPAPRPAFHTLDLDPAANHQLLTDQNVRFHSPSHQYHSHRDLTPSFSSSSSASSIYSASSVSDEDPTDAFLPTPPRPRAPQLPAETPSTAPPAREDEPTPRPPNLLPRQLPLPSPPPDNDEAPLGPGAIISSSPPRILPPRTTAGKEDLLFSPLAGPSPTSPTFAITSPSAESLLSPTAEHASWLFSPGRQQQRLAYEEERAGATTPRGTTPNNANGSTGTGSTTLRLLRPLGQGAFSSVWLADDRSPTPLALTSRRSVRDLRRAARVSSSGSSSSHSHPGSTVNDRSPTPTSTETGTLSPPPTRSTFASLPSLPDLARPGPSLSLSRNASLKQFRERVQGTRPPSFLLGRTYLDERHGEMGVHPGEEEDSGGLRRMQSTSSSSGHSTGSGESYTHPVGGISLLLNGGFCSSPTSATPPTLNIATSPKPPPLPPMQPPTPSTPSQSLPPSRASSLKRRRTRLVAVKMTPRRVDGYAGDMGRYKRDSKKERERELEEEERTRVGFVREVEVLRHISHPNITPLLTHLSTPTHHVLVLPYLPGGDLLGLVNNDVAWGKLSEPVLHRIWCELCKAVGWMHGVGLVHRDIKLENILLTTSVFASLLPPSPVPSFADLPAPPAPLIKLTDFGLSRFVEIDEHGDAELLSTRCGSEAYAAPELVMGGSGSRAEREKKKGGGKGEGNRGVYDARETDAWACGVVLYALVGRGLPFGEGVMGGKGHIGGERAAGADGGRRSAAERRAWLMRIAKGEWEWPGEGGEDGGEVTPVPDAGGELVGPTLVRSAGAKRIVSRLLVRDPQKRARIGELWDDEWMLRGPVAVLGKGTENEGEEEENEREEDVLSDVAVEDVHMADGESVIESSEDGELDEGETEGEEEDEEEEEDVDGVLLDEDGIHSIARQEVV